jgi:hypothetical protein
MQQWKNYTRFLCGPCRMKGSRRLVLPSLSVVLAMSCLYEDVVLRQKYNEEHNNITLIAKTTRMVFLYKHIFVHDTNNLDLVWNVVDEIRQSQWPRDLRQEPSWPAPTLGSWVRISLDVWMSVCVYSVCRWCPCDRLIPHPRSPTDCV